MSVVVVGSFVQDLSFSTECFPKPGETRIGEFLPGAGGKGFNQAVACSRQGVDTEFVGAVGRDAFSKTALDFVAGEKNLEANLLELSDSQTGAAAIVVDEAGQNLIVVALGANSKLSVGHIEGCKEKIKRSKLLVCQLESNTAASCAAMKLARDNGVSTLLNPAPINKEITAQVLSLVDILVPNETEFAFILEHVKGKKFSSEFWTLPVEEMKELCALLDVPTVVVTLGEHGAFVYQQDGLAQFIEPLEVDCLDSTGAGDAFVGGLSAGICLYPDSFLQALEYATGVAALSVTKKGTAPAMPTSKEVKSLISK